MAFNYVLGKEYSVQYGLESVYNTSVVPTKEIDVTSVNIKLNKEPKSLDETTGGQFENRSYAMVKMCEISMSFLARPDTIGDWLFLAFGKEGNVTSAGVEGHKHTFTCSKGSSGESLPSATFVIDNKIKCIKVSGCKLDTLKISAQTKDIVKVDVTLIGIEAGTTTLATISYTPPTPLRFAGLSYVVGTYTLYTDSINFDLSNNLSKEKHSQAVADDLTLNIDEPNPLNRSITVSGNTIFGSDSDAIRTAYWEEDDTIAVNVYFKGVEFATDENYLLKIILPVCQLTADPNPDFNLERLLSGMALKVVQPSGSTEAVTAELTNTLSTKYLV